jgi:hypothetical protein
MDIGHSISELQNLPQIITAIGGLGTAAAGLVDATKAIPLLGGGVNRIGFSGIKRAVTALTPYGNAGGASANALPQQRILDTLQANWYNGTDIASQKAAAKSLIKLSLNAANAQAMAAATGVDAAILQGVAASIAKGTPLTSPEADVFARFDLIVTALLDEVYQRSDERYRNGTKVFAMLFAIGLAFAGVRMLHAGTATLPHHFGVAVLVGVLATPLAPIAKDLSTALATAVNTLQLVKK